MDSSPATPRRGDSAGEKYRALLDAADLLVVRRSLPELFAALAERLRQVATFDFINFVLHDAERNVMRVNLWEGVRPLELPVHSELKVEESSSGWVWQHQKPLVYADLLEETAFPKVFDLLRAVGIRSYCMLPLTTGDRRLGGLGFGSLQAGAYSHGDVEFLQGIAQIVAVAVDNVLTHQALTHDRNRLRLLLDINNALVSRLEMEQLVPVISAHLRRVMPHEFTGISFYDETTRTIRPFAMDFPGSKGLIRPAMEVPVEQAPAGRALRERRAMLYKRADLEQFGSPFTQLILEEGLNSVCCLPLLTADAKPLGALILAGTREDAFDQHDLGLLMQVASQVAIALDNASAYREIAELKDKLAQEKLYLEDEIRSERNFDEMVGTSPALRRVLAQVETVAPSEATVLILGETGTGKELVARAIHALSPRMQRPFIKVNCAAIPSGLLESELFGHEKGAFTGAIGQKIGRIELAHGGTLFLDEVGDIPLELQPKLLRVLQEQEFERLGSTRTTRVNVRLIAATNRDLGKMVAEREFRSDLYYRLNVFPVRVPPLRERADDIPLLVRYFTQKFARRMDRPIETIPSSVMDALRHWQWPGNVRELENFIERSVILTRGRALQVPLSELSAAGTATDRPSTLEEAERQHILAVLRECRGVVAGRNGAATRLGLKRGTLQSKMRKLGITRRDFEP